MRRAQPLALFAAVVVLVPLAGAQAPPEPTLGKTFVLERSSGTVRVKTDAGWSDVTVATVVPFGATVDTTAGVARITTATGNGLFWKGRFVAKQAARTGALTDLRLSGGDFSKCTAAEARASRRVSVRKLFGKGKGRFRTTGRFSAATVRGTEWVVDDSCVGTLTTVESGTVEVRDFITKRTVKVRKGHRYRATRGPGAGLD
jgi:hypothetical protein